MTSSALLVISTRLVHGEQISVQSGLLRSLKATNRRRISMILETGICRLSDGEKLIVLSLKKMFLFDIFQGKMVFEVPLG
jgi:hypothetical protein